MTGFADRDSLLAERFAALATSDPGDWPDVLRRARRMRTRRALLVAGVALAVFAIAAPTALSLHGTVVDWFQATPAPHRTQIDFLQQDVIAPPEMAPGVIPGSAREVTAVRYAGRALALAVAPTKSGGFCWQWIGLTGSCSLDRTGDWPAGRKGDVNLFALDPGFMADEEGTVSEVNGRLLDPRIDRLSLLYDDGTSSDVPFVWVSAPIDAGFYFYELPSEHRTLGHRAHSLVARDSEGTLVARMIFPIPRPADVDRTAHLPDGEVTQLPANALVGRARRLIDLRTSNGRHVGVWLVPRAGGDPPCYVFERGRDCIPKGFEASPLGAGMHGGAQPVLVAGQVRSDVATYELHFEDGDAARVTPVEGFVLYEIPPSHYPRGHRLDRIRALDRNGVVIQQQAIIRPDAPGVYPCAKPVDIGYGVMACP